MILVTGANGQLGYDVIKELDKLGIPCKGVGSQDFDITDEVATVAYITQLAPKAVIHCAAYTAVDRAEEESELCTAVNVAGTAHIARACLAVGAKMMYISTDYVFPGVGERPYDVTDEPAPKNVYGLTKWQGEQVVQSLLEQYFIVRISWVFGHNGNNFVKTMLRLGVEKNELNVVADQIGSPTYTVDLASLLCRMIHTEKYGIYHATNEGFCSWADFATAIMQYAQLPCHINAIATSEYPSKAIRPLNSRLSKDSLIENGFRKLSRWEDALLRYLKP